MDLSSSDIPVVSGTKGCPRCCPNIVEILNNPREYDDSKSIPKSAITMLLQKEIIALI